MTSNENSKAVVSFIIKHMNPDDIDPLYEIISDYESKKYKVKVSKRNYKNEPNSYLVTFIIKLMDKIDINDMKNLIKEYNENYEPLVGIREYKYNYKNEEEQLEKYRLIGIECSSRYNKAHLNKIAMQQRLKRAKLNITKWTEAFNSLNNAIGIPN